MDLNQTEMTETNEIPVAESTHAAETPEEQHAAHDHDHDHSHQHGPALNPELTREVEVEAPAGLEDYPREVLIAPGKKAPLFDPAFARDFDKWKQTWDQTGILSAELGRTEQGVRDFFYFKKRDPVTGAVSASKSGYFFSDSEYARFHTEQRAGMIKGNPKEFEQWSNVFIFETSIGGSMKP